MQIPWIFMTLSTLLTFLILLVLVRWLGSTQLSQLTMFNWVAGASMGNLAASMISATTVKDWIASSYTLVLFTAVSVVAAVLALKSRWIRRVANGEPIVLIHKGELIRHNLAKTKVNVDVLMMMLREKGYFAYSDIEYGIMEPSGNLSILPKQRTQSATKEDLAYGPDLSEKGQGPYTELVVDGEIDRDKLVSTHRDEAWLMQVIRHYGATSLEEVMYLAVNREGEIVIDLSREKVEEENDDPDGK